MANGGDGCEDFVLRNLNISVNALQILVPKLCEHHKTKPNTTPGGEKFNKLCCTSTANSGLNKTDDLFGNMTAQLCYFLSSNALRNDKIIYRDICQRDEEPNYFVDPRYNLAYYMILSLLTPIGLVANILIMMTVYKVKRLRNTTGYFICNLAFADVLVIIEMVLYFTLCELGVVPNANLRVKMYIFPSFDVFLGSASLLLVTAVSIERGIAVARPLKYPRYLSEKRAKHLIICIWCYSFALFVFGIMRIWITNVLYLDIFFYLAVTCSFLIPCILVISSYNVIVVSALKTMKMEKKICKVIVAISLMNDDNIEQATKMRPNRCRELKVALKVALLTLPFVCGWGYFHFCSVYERAMDYQFKGIQNLLIIFLPYIISCVNPLTYLMFTRTLRKSAWMLLVRSCACFKLLRVICHKKQQTQMRAKLVPQDRLRQMQFSSEHSRWLETRQANTII